MLETSVIGYHSRQRGGQIGKVLISYIPIWLLGQNVKILYASNCQKYTASEW